MDYEDNLQIMLTILVIDIINLIERKEIESVMSNKVISAKINPSKVAQLK